MLTGHSHVWPRCRSTNDSYSGTTNKAHESAPSSQTKRTSAGERNRYTTLCDSPLMRDRGPVGPGLEFRDVTIVDDEDLGKPVPGDRSPRKARYWILQEYARRGEGSNPSSFRFADI
jgi:hypothetical protein